MKISSFDSFIDFIFIVFNYNKISNNYCFVNIPIFCNYFYIILPVHFKKIRVIFYSWSLQYTKYRTKLLPTYINKLITYVLFYFYPPKMTLV